MPDVPRRILVIDEDMETRVFLENVLRSAGHTPILTENADKGIERALAEKPHLIVLEAATGKDMANPLYPVFRKDPVLSCIPILVLSILDENTLMHVLRLQSRQTASGFVRPDACLGKPPETCDLLDTIERLTGKDAP